jgi:hypothetical protein
VNQVFFMTTITSRNFFNTNCDVDYSTAHVLSYLVAGLNDCLTALQSPWAVVSAFQFHDHFTDGRTPWTSDQLVVRPLPKHRTTQTQNKHTPNIHALCGIRTHDRSF